MKLCAATYFTKGWTYCVSGWLDHFHAAVSGFSGVLIVSTDQTDQCLERVSIIKERLKDWSVIHRQIHIESDSHPPYGEQAQLIIAKLQGAAFSSAREIGADLFWSIESDILVPPNSMKILKQAIEFDDNYYGVAMITYPNGQFLGGRGTEGAHICPDIYDDERKIPKSVLEKKKHLQEALKRNGANEKLVSEMQKNELEIKECPPAGNIFHLQSKKWRKRGWLEAAYPGIGRGAILPTDWVGLGCTMMNKKALSLATFYGYPLRGTQDLFLCWRRWHQNDIRMCVIPHVACAHVKKVSKNGTDEIIIFSPYHEKTGEYEGHLRVEQSKYCFN